MIEVILREDVQSLGRAGEMVRVKPGYARNYLVPQGMGFRATPGILKQAERRSEEERLRQLELKQQAEVRKTALQSAGPFIISKQVGEADAIFGTVTNQEVAELIFNSTSQEVDRRGITLPEIRQTGTYKAEIKLHAEVTAEVDIQVVPM